MKNKKLLSRFLAPMLIVGIFAVTAVNSAFGADATTTTTIANVAPSFTADTAEEWTQAWTGSITTLGRASSSTTYPTNEGTIVTFKATADDTNNDNYYMIVCESAGVSANNSAAPSCTGTPVCVSSSTVDAAEASCTKSTTGLTNETYNWYSYVCDHNGASSCSSVSDSSQGGINDEVGSGGTPTASGSPYHVNHAPTFTSGTIVDSGDATIAPGETVKFVNSVDADGDTNGTQDLINYYVCSGETDNGGVTTAFDFDDKTCTGGTKLCSATSVNPSSADATCNDTTSIVSVPTAHASDYGVIIYVDDAHGFNAAAGESKDYAVIDVAPVFVSYTTADTLTIAAGSGDTLTRAVAYTDDNGDRDVTALDFVFFEDTSVADTCTSDQNDCYPINSVVTTSLGSSAPTPPTDGCYTSTLSAAGTGKTLTGSDNAVTITCDFNIYFNSTASANWEVSSTATDGLGAVNFADSNVNTTVAALSAIGVDETSIAYGGVAVGADSTFSASTTATMENQGNQVIDVLLQGTDMTVSSFTIVAAQQKWHHTAATFDWASGGGTALVTSAAAGLDAAGCLNRDLAVRAVYNVGTEDEAIAWRIRIPAAQEAGSYSGTNTFSATSNSDCTGPSN